MNNTARPRLSLYYFLTCPYCANVLDCIGQLNIKVDKCDIWKDERHRQKLLDDTGSQTVPCLYVDGQSMRESNEIIRWLNENVDNLEKA